MKKTLIFCFALLLKYHSLAIASDLFDKTNTIVTDVKQITIPGHSGAYNPSIIKYKDGYLMTFRDLPNRLNQPWISHIYVVTLNESFEPLSSVTQLDTRPYKITPSQAEDARLFSYNGKIYLIYNDNMDAVFPTIFDRRDIHIAELKAVGNTFKLADPIKLFHERDYASILWQKNWTPFEWKGTLLMSYTLNPKVILCPDLTTGQCAPCYETRSFIHWPLGPLRGGTPALLIDGEYWGFFHSNIYAGSPFSNNQQLWHYFMGAYAFSAEPPFEITKVSPCPLCHPQFYSQSKHDKRVIYPGGFVVKDSNLYIAYGKDDCEIWIATIDFDELKKSMVSATASPPALELNPL